MSGRGSKKHTHKYHKIELNYTPTWACALPDCTHFMPKHMESMVVGKNSLCWQCNSVFKLNDENMKDDKPICSNCKLGIEEIEDELPISSALAERINKQ